MLMVSYLLQDLLAPASTHHAQTAPSYLPHAHHAFRAQRSGYRGERMLGYMRVHLHEAWVVADERGGRNAYVRSRSLSYVYTPARRAYDS